MKIRNQKINLEKFKTDIEYFSSQNWLFKKWTPSAAIKDRSGSIVKYTGQKYDHNYFQYLEKGWVSDHCEICLFLLHDSEEVDELFGYSDGNGDWLCFECYRKIISKDFEESEFLLRNKFKMNNEKAVLLISPMIPDYKFEITETSKFGEYDLEVFLDIPRKVLENGNQDYNTYAIMLKNPGDIDFFEEEKVYKLSCMKDVEPQKG